MLDINFIRQNPEKVKKACENKGVKVDIDKVLELDKKRRELILKSENLRAEQKKIGRPAFAPSAEGLRPGREDIEKAKELKEQFKAVSCELAETEKEFKELMLQVPNVPAPDAPIGKDETGNKVLKIVGKPKKFNFPVRSHLELGEALDLIDVKRAGKVAGSRFAYLKNELVLLEFALVNFAFHKIIKKGFIPILPPIMVKPEMARSMGYLEQNDEEEAYYLPKDGLYLAGTSEQPIGAMHQGEIFIESDLPRRYLGFSTCFRREAGSYGKDTKGILRVHQFNKLEMVSFCKPEESEDEHEFLVSIEEELMQILKIPYRLVKMCTGDLGDPAAAKFDIDAWFPSEGKYRETHSCSNCTDYQARRLNIRFKTKAGETEFVHILNGTVFSERPILAILENYQKPDGSVEVPEVLRQFIGKDTISPKS